MTEPIDARLDKIDTSHTRLHNLISEIEDILGSLIHNDTEILEALTQMLLVVPQMQARNEQNQAKMVEEIRNELRRFTVELLEKNSQPQHGGKAIIAAADAFSAANPEVGLLQYLYSFLPDRVALDIGANVGDVAERLEETGYEVYAFEPNPPTFEALQKKMGGKKGLHLFQMAVGASNETMHLHVAVDPTGANKYGDPSLFSSLIKHPMPGDLPFTQEVPVPVRTLESLRHAGEIPDRAGLIKIDTEGFDLEVIRGMGEDSTPVVMAEFWDAAHSFGRTGNGRLDELVTEMKGRGYGWYVVIYHQDETGTISYYCNRAQTMPDSWGNVVFFREHDLFVRAHSWCEHALTATILR